MLFFDRSRPTEPGMLARNDNYDSNRLLLAKDGAPVGMTDAVIKPGVLGTYGYPDRTEIAYCVSGDATVVDQRTGREQRVQPGVLE